MSSSSYSTADDHDGGSITSITTFHQDIILTHILTRLDGQTLAATACASSQLHALSTQDQLWRDICTSTWPSIKEQRVKKLISAFPSGPRSFFSDSFPVLDHQQPSKHNLDHSSILTKELIACVDIYYKTSLIISKTQQIETVSSWFWCSPFRVDLFDPKESIATPVLHGGLDDTWLQDLEENLTMSWILIDPSQKRALNISSGRPVLVERHWLTGDIQARFATIMAGDTRPGMEFVKCEATVTYVGKEGGDVHVSEVSMQVEDMEGRSLNGKDSLVILQEAMDKGKRLKGQGKEGQGRYDEFVKRKREIRERREKRERVLDMLCISIGVTLFLAFWSFTLFR